MLIFDCLLRSFKWYRKRLGGKWYKVFEVGSEGGIEGPIRYWTQELPNEHDDEIEVVAEEDWGSPAGNKNGNTRSKKGPKLEK